MPFTAKINPATARSVLCNTLSNEILNDPTTQVKSGLLALWCYLHHKQFKPKPQAKIKRVLRMGKMLWSFNVSFLLAPSLYEKAISLRYNLKLFFQHLQYKHNHWHTFRHIINLIFFSRERTSINGSLVTNVRKFSIASESDHEGSIYTHYVLWLKRRKWWYKAEAEWIFSDFVSQLLKNPSLKRLNHA